MKMKAVVCTKYGPPEVLQIREVEKPIPSDNEVLIKIYATTCHIGDVRIRSFKVPFWQMIPLRLYLGIRKPKRPILGLELAGEVEAVGPGVKRFKTGDRVFGSTGFSFGAYAEYRCLPVDGANMKDGLVATIPSNLTYEEAAAGTATGGMTALSLLRKSRVETGQKVLIYGASGSVGTFAIQLANLFGAEVTGVCSAGNVEMVRALGAEKVIDYAKEDFTRSGDLYDVIIDAVGKFPGSRGKKAVRKTGTYLNVNRDSGSGHDQRMKDFVFLTDLLARGKIRPVIDRVYRLDQIVEAHRYVEKGHKKGNVVITVAR